MSINSINNTLLSTLASTSRVADPAHANVDRSSNAATQALQQAHQRAAVKPQQPIAAATQSVVPPEAPAGTDPELWSVLTTEERTFFAKTASLGPLTYGRIKAATQAAPPAPRGVRLDVRA